MKHFFQWLCFFVFFIFSCNEKNKSFKKNNIQSLLLPIVNIQNYETLLGDLQLQTDSLLQKKIKSYTAIQTFEKKHAKKFYFHSFIKLQGNLMHCELKGKDTIISEKIIEVNPSSILTEKKWHQINKKVLIQTITNQNNKIIYIINKEKNKLTDSIKFIRKNNLLSTIHYPKNEKEIYTYHDSNTMTVSYLNKKKETIYSYINKIQHNKIINKNYSTGSNHIYEFYYNKQNELTTIIWKENKNKINATIQFHYSQNGLLQIRKINSTINSFGNSTTQYYYK